MEDTARYTRSVGDVDRCIFYRKSSAIVWSSRARLNPSSKQEQLRSILFHSETTTSLRIGTKGVAKILLSRKFDKALVALDRYPCVGAGGQDAMSNTEVRLRPRLVRLILLSVTLQPMWAQSSPDRAKGRGQIEKAVQDGRNECRDRYSCKDVREVRAATEYCLMTTRHS